MNQERGFSLVETLLCLSVVVTLVMAGFAVSYIYFLNTWVNYHAYEALVCALERGGSVDHCLKEFTRHTQRFLPRGVEHDRRLSRQGRCAYFHSFTRARLRWKLTGRTPYQIWKKDLSACLPGEMKQAF